MGGREPGLNRHHEFAGAAGSAARGNGPFASERAFRAWIEDAQAKIRAASDRLEFVLISPGPVRRNVGDGGRHQRRLDLIAVCIPTGIIEIAIGEGRVVEDKRTYRHIAVSGVGDHAIPAVLGPSVAAFAIREVDRLQKKVSGGRRRRRGRGGLPANSPLNTKPAGRAFSIGPNFADSRYSPVAANGSVPLAGGQVPSPPGTGKRNHPKLGESYGVPFNSWSEQRVRSVSGAGLAFSLA
jgi:hypothetical protein